MAATALPVWTLGELMEKARRDAHITTQQMADHLRVTRKTINNYEANRVTVSRAVLLAWIDRCNRPWFTLEGISDLLPNGLPWIHMRAVQLSLFRDEPVDEDDEAAEHDPAAVALKTAA